MSKIKCANCGNSIDTLPTHCGQDMIYNEETNQMECYMGSECGYMELDNLLCENCRNKC